MKDYSKVKFVKPSVDSFFYDGSPYFIKDKVYELNVFGNILNESGYECIINVNEKSSHLRYKGVFIPCDENGKELDNE